MHESKKSLFVPVMADHLKKSDRVAEPHTAADLGREVLDERNMVVIELVVQVVGVDRKDIRRVLCRLNVRRDDVSGAVAGGRRFVCKDTILPSDGDKLGPNAKSVVMKVETDANTHRRNTRQRAAVLELGIDVIESREDVKIFSRS